MIVMSVYNSMMKSIKMTHFGIPLSPDHLEQLLVYSITTTVTQIFTPHPIDIGCVWCDICFGGRGRSVSGSLGDSNRGVVGSVG